MSDTASDELIERLSATEQWLAQFDKRGVGDAMRAVADARALIARLSADKARMGPGAASVSEVAAEQWQELLEKDDRTSPAEYPDMVLVTRKELEFAMDCAIGAAQSWWLSKAPPASPPNMEELREALKPFAELGRMVLAEAPEGAETVGLFASATGERVKVRLDDFRRAAALQNVSTTP